MIDPKDDGLYIYSGDHQQRAIDSLIDLFRKPRNSAWVSAAAGQLQDLEDAFWSLLTAFDLDSQATIGPALDMLGKVVGELRDTRADSDFRAAIRARILVNGSNGRIEELYQILRTLLPDGVFTIEELQPARIRVTVTSAFTDAGPRTTGTMLRQAKAAGVTLDYIAISTSGTMIWSSAGASIPDSVTGWGQPWGFLL